MNLLANAHWQPAPKVASVLRRCAMVAALTAVGAIAAQYLAGYFFLWSLHADPRRATPVTILQYWLYYGHIPFIRHRAILCSAAGLSLVTALAAVLVIPKRRALHGEARFARKPEIARAGLFANEGLILGKMGSRYLMLPGQQSVILAAPPRSGKDVGVVVPNGLNWPGSLVQVDIKRENWTITAGFRGSRGQACFRFEPLAANGDTARWNCLSYVSQSPDRRINDIQRIADILYAETPGTDPFWVASARSLFLGICLYLFETQRFPKTIGEVRRQGMASDDEGFGAHWKRIVQGRQSGKFPLSAECVRALYDVIDLAPVTASSVRKTFTSRLDLWANPLLDAATSGDDFDLRALRKKPMSIYVCVNPDDLHRLRPVLSLFFQQTIGLQTTELPEHNPHLKHQVLMLLNEFTALGKIPIVSESMSYLPGYNVRVLLVIQAPSQLRDVYGPYAAETMLKSVAAKIVFAPKDYPDAKEISDELGFTTVRVRSHSRPSFMALNRQSGRSGSTTFSEQPRALLLPQEVKEIGNDSALIFYEGLKPIRCKKIRYYADRRFRARLLPPPRNATPVPRKSTPVAPHAPTTTAASASAPAPADTESLTAQPSVAITSPMTIAMHVAGVKDIEHLDSLKLEDFSAPLQNLNFEHAGERPTESELDADVNHFIDAIR
jgi:type IV secretion system protein VirD4